MPSKEIEHYIMKILKNVYKKDKMKKYDKKIRKVRKNKHTTKDKKKALHQQFKFVDKLIDHNLRKLNRFPMRIYTPRRKHYVRYADPHRVDRLWRRTARDIDPYANISNMYSAMYDLDFINKQKTALDHYSNQKWLTDQQNAYNAYSNAHHNN